MSRRVPPPPTKYGPKGVSQPKPSGRPTPTFQPPPTKFGPQAAAQTKMVASSPRPPRPPIRLGFNATVHTPHQKSTLQRMEDLPIIQQPTAKVDELLGRSCHRYAPIVAMQVAGIISTDQQEVDSFIKKSEGRLGGGGGAGFSDFSAFKKIDITVFEISATEPGAAKALCSAVSNRTAVAIGVKWEDPNIIFLGTLVMAGSGIKYTFTTTRGHKHNVEKPPGKDYFALRDGDNWRPLLKLNSSTKTAAKDLLSASKSPNAIIEITGKTGNHWIYALPGTESGGVIRAKDQQNPDRMIEIDAATMTGADDKGRKYQVTQFAIGQKA